MTRRKPPKVLITNSEAIGLEKLGVRITNNPNKKNWKAWEKYTGGMFPFQAPEWAVRAYQAGYEAVPHEMITKAIRSQPTRRRIAALVRLLNP